jgi:hypothetical protein
MNRDPQLWSEPTSFRPERFLGENRDSVLVPKHFMPFQVSEEIVCSFGIFGWQFIYVVCFDNRSLFSLKATRLILFCEKIKIYGLNIRIQIYHFRSNTFLMAPIITLSPGRPSSLRRRRLWQDDALRLRVQARLHVRHLTRATGFDPQIRLERTGVCSLIPTWKV